jgi:acyl carrier protein
MQPSTVAERLRNFVTQRFPAARGLSDQASLLEAGAVDSSGILEIVMFIEEAFGLTLSDDELVADNFQSIDALAAFVAAKSRGG